MSVELTVGNETFDYPQSGEAPGWGEDATAWAVAVTNLIENLQSASDISQTTFTIANNQSSAANVNGLLFSTSLVRSAIIQYSVFRTNIVESGEMFVNYNNSSSSWNLSRDYAGDAGMTFSITNAGQVQYTSTNATSGNMHFRAQTLSQ